MLPQQMLSSLVVAIVTVAISSKCYCTATEYYVSAADGPPCPNNTICHPLSFYENNQYQYFTSNTVFYFMEGNHILSKELLISVSDITFKGLGSIVQGFDETVMQSTVILKCLNNSYGGLTFMNGEKIFLSHITITGCKRRVLYDGIVSAYQLDGVTLEYVSIINNTGFGLHIESVSIINISSCSFAANRKLSKPEIATNSVYLLVVNGLILQDTNITHHGREVNGLAIIAMRNTNNFITATITINNAIFYKNEKLACGIFTIEDITLNKFNEDVIHWRYVFIKNCVFKNNTDGINFHLEARANLYFENVHFSYNVGKTLRLRNYDKKFNGIVNYDFQNVTLTQNSDPGTRYPVLIFQASDRADIVTLTLKDTIFSKNHGTALFVNNFAHVALKTAVIFRDNTGYNGGAIVMGSDTPMEVSNMTKVMFIDNHAINHGGAIYVLPNVNEVGQHFIVKNCFYRNTTQLNDKTIFYFNNNTAGKSGSAIYGSNVVSCENQWLFSDISNFTNQPGFSVISSDVLKVCFCDDGKPSCLIRNKTITATPGEIINFSVTAVGDMDGFVQSVLQISDGFSLSNQNVSAKCAHLNHTVKVVDIDTETTVITVSDVDSPYGLSPLPVDIYVNIAPCPDGFDLSPDTGVCQCDSIVSSVAECHPSNGTVTRQGNIWLAYDDYDNCTIAHHNCPFDYCITDSVTLSLTNPNVQCNLNRAGRLCGGCQHEYSLSLGSNKCQKCQITKPTYLLAIPFGIAGIALVALLIVLNLTVSVGTINGLIFFANIVKLYEPIFFPNGPIIFLSQFISWLNLDLGIETCFYPGMTSCHKMWLQFVFPFYVWILMMIVIIACRYSIKVTHIVGNNAVPVLATLLLLSYTKLLRTIILIISLTRVSCNDVTTLYWLVDPNIPYLSSCHLPLFIVAVSILSILVVPYTLFLLLFPLLTRHSHKWQKCYNKLKPFIDAYGGPHKDRFHFWIGVLVLLRVILALVIALADNPIISSNTLFAILVVLMTFQCSITVYKNKYNHTLDIWFMLSLLFINYIANLEENALNKAEPLSTYTMLEKTVDNMMLSTCMVVILSISLAIFVGILVYHICKHIIVRQYRKMVPSPNERHNHLLLPSDDLDDELREPLLAHQDDIDK